MEDPTCNGRSYCRRNRIKFVHGGSEFICLLKKLIDDAQHSIQLQVYIFLDDKTGKIIGDALMNAAKRGVQVHLLVDGYGSRTLSKAYIEKLSGTGVHFQFFHKLFQNSKFFIGRRLHHKVIVIDGFHALICGANIADRYNDFPDRPAWLDLAVLVEGEVARELFFICNQKWKRHDGKEIKLPEDVEKAIAAIPESEYCSIRISRNDWLEKEMQVLESYDELINNATESITIICSYFLPGLKVRRWLKKAAKRGVKVKVVLTRKSDVTIFKLASRYLYRWMLRQKIELYEYQPTVLHAKATVADEQFVTIGSYNLDRISAHVNIEMNLDVDNKSFARTISGEIEKIIEKDCKSINASNYHMGFLAPAHLPQILSYLFIRSIVKLSTFYFTLKE